LKNHTTERQDFVHLDRLKSTVWIKDGEDVDVGVVYLAVTVP